MMTENVCLGLEYVLLVSIRVYYQYGTFIISSIKG